MLIAPQMPPCTIDGSKMSDLEASTGTLTLDGKAEESVNYAATYVSSAVYMCLVCPAKFTGKDDLKLHWPTHSAKSGNEQHKTGYFVADVTSAVRLLSDTLCTGITSENGWLDDIYICLLCPAKFNHKRDLKLHWLTHSCGYCYCCCECGATFTTEDCIRTHVATCTQKPSPKSDDDSFSSRRSLSRREFDAVKHSHDRSFQCVTCGAEFSRADHLRRHRMKHSGSRSYACAVCYAKFRRPDHLKRHKLIHSGDRPHKCRRCAATFCRREGLYRHIATH